jgi:hypothetical protein
MKLPQLLSIGRNTVEFAVKLSFLLKTLLLLKLREEFQVAVLQ